MQDVETATSKSLKQKRLLSFLVRNVAPRADASDKKPFPVGKAGVVSKTFFWWTNPIMKVGYTRTLEPNDLFQLEGDWTVRQSTQTVKAELAKLSKSELTYKDIMLVLIRTFWQEWVKILLILTLFGTMDSFSPLVTKHLIIAIEERMSGYKNAIGKGVGIAVASNFMTLSVEILIAHASFRALALGTRIKCILTSLILEKLFKLSPKGRHKFPTSKITSICTTDLSRIEIACLYASFLLLAPIPVIVSIVLLAINLGVTSVVSVGLLVAASISLSFSVKKLYAYRSFVVNITDKRVNIMKEIVSNLKIIKFYNWEMPYFKSLMEARNSEISVILKIQTLRNILNTTSITLTALVSMVSFIVLYAIEGRSRLAANVFSALQSFSTLSIVLNVVPLALSSVADFVNGLKRVADLLSQEEVSGESHYNIISKDGPAINVKDATFIWEQFDDEDDAEDEKSIDDGNASVYNQGIAMKDLREISDNENQNQKLMSLNNVNLKIEKGDFVVVTGSIGSGKSSLLNALAGFMTCESGSVEVNGELIFCGEPWIQNCTIRDNITFGMPFERTRYDEIIYACSLQADLDVLPGGDLTEVGEKGITLSGGQKARICLARSLYHGGDIILMDDVLSAVDARVGKHIVQQCCLNLLAGKTRILATHQLSLVETADKVIFMNGDGTFDFGVYEDIKKNEKFAKLLSYNQQKSAEEQRKLKESKEAALLDTDSTDITEVIGESEDKDRFDQLLKRRMVKTDDVTEVFEEVDEEFEFKDVYANKDASKGKIIEEEEKAVNSLKGYVYKTYIKFGAGKITVPGFLVLFTITSAIAVFGEIFSNTWLSFWVSDKFDKPSNFYIGLYVLFTMLFFIFLLFEYVAVAFVASNALKKLNIAAAKRVLGAPMSFLDVTPLGRILNRFTKDTDALDNEIADNLKRLVYSLSFIIGLIVLNLIYLPWIGIVIPLLGAAYVGVANYYQASSREIKRLEAVQRSFVINNLSEMLNGMNTIKAFNKKEYFLLRNERFMDETNEATFLSNAVSRWLAISLQMIASTFGLIVCVLSAAGVFKLLPATVGLLINNVIGLSYQLSAITSFITQVENDMNSVERLIFYADKIPQEENPEIQGLTPQKEVWPLSGKLEFDNVSMLYRPGLPPVLKNLSFKVQAAEKIGVCGRTGAGKSSIMATIFRLHELDSGAILYDNMDISKLSLTALRSNISIIPQEPVLFSGTIRRNLDPFGEQTDDTLWDALRRSEILSEEEIGVERARAKTEDAENMHKFHLDQTVSEEGANYSVGERQLISFARALVRNTKILILDEATSSVDYETDHKIQSTINREFGHCTILCIAHRLKTILHYDKILTLDRGEIRQFDKPKVLFHENGIFRQMCDRSGITADDF